MESYELRRIEVSTWQGVGKPKVIILSNNRIALVALIFGWIQMWALWACAYMHQMYPLIEPKI
jgi:hypothetical protein